MHIAVLVPDPDYPEPWRWTFDVEADALKKAGCSVDPIAWTKVGDISSYDLVMPLVAWGYHLEYARWLQLLDRAETEAWPMINPPALLRWNGDKAYLAELGDAGVPGAFLRHRDLQNIVRESTAIDGREGGDGRERGEYGDQLLRFHFNNPCLGFPGICALPAVPQRAR
jgi:hypothetical protein